MRESLSIETFNFYAARQTTIVLHSPVYWQSYPFILFLYFLNHSSLNGIP